MLHRLFCFTAAISAAGAVSLAGPAARAQSGETKQLGAAQTIFDRAVQLMDAHKYDEACPKLEEVVRLVPAGLGARLRLAECYEKAGKLASAWTTYTVAESAAATAGQQERAQFARDHAATLKPRLSKLVIRVAEGLRKLEGFSVKRDGAEVSSAEWGLPVPVDPGKHTVVVSAAQKKPWEASVEVKVEAQEVAVSAPPSLDDAPGATTGVDKPAGGAPAWAWAVGGAGLAFAGVSIAFLIDDRSIQATIHEHCTKVACDRKDGFVAAPANSRLYRDFGLFVGFGAASVLALGTSIVAIAVAPPRRPAATGSLRAVPWLSPGSAGLTLQGAL